MNTFYQTGQMVLTFLSVCLQHLILHAQRHIDARIQHTQTCTHTQSAGGRLQLIMRAPNIRCFAQSDMTWCMVVWWTLNVLRWQQFHVAPSVL